MNLHSIFTNKYSLSKTLRFQLKPIENTPRMIKENYILQKDKNRKIAYEKTKIFIDKLHQEFINDSLTNIKIYGLDNYLELYKQFKLNKNNLEFKKNLELFKQSLRQQIFENFEVTIKKWINNEYSNLKTKEISLDILFQEEIFSILDQKYKDYPETKIYYEEGKEETSIFRGWKNFTGYFKKFFETRKNLYKTDGTSTSIITRIVDNNLDKFIDNLITYQLIKNKDDLSLLEINTNNLDSIFTLNNYDNCILQEGVDKYNQVLGGISLENGQKVIGINEIISNYNQTHMDSKLPFLKKLDRQILSFKDNSIDTIESEDELFDCLEAYYNIANQKIRIIEILIKKIISSTSQFDIAKVYINTNVFNPYSTKWLSNQYSDDFYQKILKSIKKYNLVTKDYIPLLLLKDLLDNYSADQNIWNEKYYQKLFTENYLTIKQTHWNKFLKILEYEFSAHFNELIDDNDQSNCKIEFANLIKQKKIDSKSKLIIKNYLDAVLRFYRLTMYFAVEKKRSWIKEYELDSEFYNHNVHGFKYNFYENAYEEIIIPYNKIRNYLTQKPYSQLKWKLNFDNPTLADGWDKNKESDNSAVILRKDRKYYLAIMKKNYNQIFSDKNKVNYSTGSNHYFEKMVYKLIPDPKKDFPKAIFSKKGIITYQPTEEILNIYKHKTYIKSSPNFSKAELHKLINFFKSCIPLHPSWKLFKFDFRNTTEYQDLSEFYSEISNSAYKIWFERVDEDYVWHKNNLGELFLFQIYNKDFSDVSSGTKNLHTRYFEELFSDYNLNYNFPFKLNGQAELFFRPKSLEVKEEYRGENQHQPKHKITVKKRYTEDKFFFHVPITLNRNAQSINKYFNDEINNYLVNNPHVNIIGIDRGERHLAYYSVINQSGEILESESLNIINGVDYHSKLNQKSIDRDQSRRDWQTIEKIKDLKYGYISQVINHIAKLVIKYNAIIVMEDLNMRFKQIRGGIEKSIYQQLEKTLISKLNYYIDKSINEPDKDGNIFRAYQLTAPFTTFKDMGKQTGIIFYTQASYTSKIDPLTGWRPNLYLKYRNTTQAKADILRFKQIIFNQKQDRFEFTYDLRDFNKQVKEDLINYEWTVCSCVQRIKWSQSENHNKGKYNIYPNLTDNFKLLFRKYEIDIHKPIKLQIETLNNSNNHNFYKDFIYFFSLICQIRNSQSNDNKIIDQDYIMSPVEPFFDSRYASKYGFNFLSNGDANGAYNIARKGLIILDKISKYKTIEGRDKKLTWKDLYISNGEWDNYITKQHKNPIV